MPKKEFININGFKSPGVNIHYTVGAGISLHNGNGQADVMLIQALFRYIAISSRVARYRFGASLQDLPEISGICDPKTIRAIWNFQNIHARQLLSLDGRIHPASYENRVIKNGPSTRLMAITLLHNLAYDESAMRNERDYIAGLIKLEPRLAPWLA